MFVVLIYRSAFRYFDMGYASALSVVLFLALAALTALIFVVSRRWIFYAGEGER